MDQVVSDLMNAKAYLLLHGLYQGRYVPNQGAPWNGQKACSYGAIYLAIHPDGISGLLGSSEKRARFRDASRYLSLSLPGRDIVTYNDAPGRTLEEVVKVFDAAIRRRREFLDFIAEYKERKGNV